MLIIPVPVLLAVNLHWSASVIPGKPVAVPLLEIVQPEGIVSVSPLAPSVRLVPDCGSKLSTEYCSHYAPIILYAPQLDSSLPAFTSAPEDVVVRT